MGRRLEVYVDRPTQRYVAAMRKMAAAEKRSVNSIVNEALREFVEFVGPEWLEAVEADTQRAAAAPHAR